MKKFNEYLEQTLDDVEDVSYDETDPKSTIINYLREKGLLELSNPEQGEVKLLQKILNEANIKPTFNTKKYIFLGQ